MKIGILFNRQGSGIATALQSMLPGSDITHFLLPQEAATPAQREMTHAALSACDYVVSQLTGGSLARYPPMSCAAPHATSQPCQISISEVFTPIRFASGREVLLSAARPGRIIPASP